MLRLSKTKEDAVLPTRKHSNDAGLDLYSYGNHLIRENEIKIIPTAIKIALPKDCVGLIWPKSRSNYLIGGGVVDEGYQGEILVKIINLSGEDIYISHGEAIAQFLIQPCYTPAVEEVVEKDLFTEESTRGFTGGMVTEFMNGIVLCSGEYNPKFDRLLAERYGNSNYTPETVRKFFNEDPYEKERSSMLDEKDPLIGYNGEMED